MSDQERTLNVDINDNEIALFLKNPNVKDKREAKRVYNTILSDALNCGAPLRAKLPDILKKQDLWGDDKQAEYDAFVDSLYKMENQLHEGGIKLSEARDIAIKVRETRVNMRMLLAPQASLISLTAEAQAEDEEFNYLVSKCTVYNTNRNKSYFSGYEDYLSRMDETASIMIATKFAELYRGFWNNEDSLPEVQFLQKFNFVDDEMRLINKDGHLVDFEGRLINQIGQYVELDGDGNDVVTDLDGVELDGKGFPKVEFKPFLDDDGKPICVDAQKDGKKAPVKTPKKRGRPKKKTKVAK